MRKAARQWAEILSLIGEFYTVSSCRSNWQPTASGFRIFLATASLQHSTKTPKSLEIALNVLKKEGNRNVSRNTSFTSNVKDSMKNQISENMARFFGCWTWKFERSSLINYFLFTLFYIDTYIIKEIQKNLHFRFRSLIWKIFFLIKDAKRKQTFRYKFSSLKFVSLLIARSLFKSAYFRNCR